MVFEVTDPYKTANHKIKFIIYRYYYQLVWPLQQSRGWTVAAPRGSFVTLRVHVGGFLWIWVDLGASGTIKCFQMIQREVICVTLGLHLGTLALHLGTHGVHFPILFPLWGGP